MPASPACMNKTEKNNGLNSREIQLYAITGCHNKHGHTVLTFISSSIEIYSLIYRRYQYN